MGNRFQFLKSVIAACSFAVTMIAPVLGFADFGHFQNDELKRELKKHIEKEHSKPIGYDTARSLIVGQLHAKQGPKGPFVRDVYCLREYKYAGKALSPVTEKFWYFSAGDLNVEHTWPQSRFNESEAKEKQKADLHHLFPSDKEVNNSRGNMKFGEIGGKSEPLKCDASRMGSGPDGRRFEPPDSHKGNVARALFYFSIHYGLSIDADEEKALKNWNHLDPVDDPEMERNDRIEEIQGNRNPFIDEPELADRISNF